jgi:hypothetical protein
MAETPRSLSEAGAVHESPARAARAPATDGDMKSIFRINFRADPGIDTSLYECTRSI